MNHIFTFLVSTLLMALFSAGTLFVAEITDVFKLKNSKIDVTFGRRLIILALIKLKHFAAIRAC